MGKRFTSEEEIENQLIQQLINGESQWSYRQELKTEESLWQNFFDKLEQNLNAIKKIDESLKKLNRLLES